MTVLDPKIFTLTTPAISALVAMLIVLYDVFEEGGDQRRTKLKLVLFFASTAITTSSIFIYFYFPYFFRLINGIYMFSIIAMPFFYMHLFLKLQVQISLSVFQIYTTWHLLFWPYFLLLFRYLPRSKNKC